MYTYCLFCDTVKCRAVANAVMQRIPCRAIYPKQVQHTWSHGKMVDIEHDLLPGYVFLFSEERLVDYDTFAGIDGVIRRVGRTETGYELEGADRDFAFGLLEKDGKVGALKMVKVGETVRLEDSLFDGSEGVVTKIDYRKERARVDFKFEGNDCHAWVAVDGIRPLKKE